MLGLGNIPPRRCTQFRPEDRSSLVEANTMDLVSVHLKNLDTWEVQVLEQVVQLEVGA